MIKTYADLRTCPVLRNAMQKFTMKFQTYFHLLCHKEKSECYFCYIKKRFLD